MVKLSDTQKRYLEKATNQYHASLDGSAAESHLEKRGLLTPTTRTALSKYRLGFVEEPVPGHEQYKGMLAIPYLRWAPKAGWTVVSIRFRCLLEHQHGQPLCHKYNTVAGDTSRLYNTAALLEDSDDVGISEGEPDALSATLSGIPTAGVAGAQGWKKHFTKAFLGYRTVFVFGDGDSAGRTFANKVASGLPNGRAVIMPDGEDVSSIVASHGKQGLMKRIYR